MEQLVRALGWKGARGYCQFIGIVVLLSGALTVGGYLLAGLLAAPVWLVQAVMWLPWLVWLGYFFPRHHQATVAKDVSGAYRLAFFRHIAPGISWNFAQMARPGLVGVIAFSFDGLRPFPAAIGLTLVAIGIWAIVRALRSIGFARALFAGEYNHDLRRLAISGIYSWIRHPMFVGGMLVSVGSSIFFWTPQALAIAVVNIVLLPAYCLVEDRRCQLVYGEYADYRRIVPGLFLWSVRTSRDGLNVDSDAAQVRRA